MMYFQARNQSLVRACVCVCVCVCKRGTEAVVQGTYPLGSSCLCEEGEVYRINNFAKMLTFSTGKSVVKFYLPPFNYLIHL